jgi:hypothetical protein
MAPDGQKAKWKEARINQARSNSVESDGATATLEPAVVQQDVRSIKDGPCREGSVRRVVFGTLVSFGSLTNTRFLVGQEAPYQYYNIIER